MPCMHGIRIYDEYPFINWVCPMCGVMGEGHHAMPTYDEVVAFFHPAGVEGPPSAP